MDEAMIKRIMPHSIEAERSVIGSMLMDAEAITAADEILTAQDFYGQQYAVLFTAMIELYQNAEAVDLVTVTNKLKEMDAPTELTGIEFVRELLEAVPTSANIKAYANIVKEKSILRKIIKTNDEIANNCYFGKDSLENILNDTEKKIFGILQSRDGGDYVPIKQIVINALEKIEEASKAGGVVTGVPSGYLDLDYMTAGFQKSDLILLAARPSMGKTAIVLNIAEYIAIRKNITAAVFSLEMSKEQLVNRILSMESHVNSQQIRTGKLEDSDWERLVESASMIGNSKLIIDDTPSITISELRSKCRKYKIEHDLGIVIIDYLQLMSGGGRSESRQQEISEISRALKGLARELNVPIIALSQLSRAVEARTDHRPMLSDLRESGAIEQDADVVMFLYRDEYYDHESPDKGIAEVIIAKQRNGPTGTIKLVWLPDYTRFVNMEK